MSVFNQELSKATPQKAGVVDQTAGMNYEMAGGILKQSQEAYSQEQYRQVNQEINQLKENRQSEEMESPVLKSARDDIEMELLKKQQGIINEEQFKRSVYAIAAKKKSSAIFHSKEIDNLVNSAIGDNDYIKKRNDSKNDLEEIKNKVVRDKAEAREKLSYQLFNSTSTQLNNEQLGLLVEHERNVGEALIRQGYNNVNAEITKGKELTDEEREINNKNYNYTAGIENSSQLNILVKAFGINVVNSVGKSQNNYDASVANFKKNSSLLENNYIENCIKNNIKPDEDILKSNRTIVENAVKSYGDYSKFTSTSQDKVKLNDYLLAQKVENEQKKSTGQTAELLSERLRILGNPIIQNLDSPDKSIRERTAKSINPELYKMYTNENGSFNVVKYKEDLLKTLDYTNEDNEKQIGSNKVDAMNKQIYKMQFAGIDKSTMLLLKGAIPDPQQNAINYIQNKQSKIAVEKAKASDYKDVDGSFKYIKSNDKMFNSDSYSTGQPNTEVFNSREKEMSNSFEISGSQITDLIYNSPDLVSINSKGDVVLSTPNGENMLEQLYIGCTKSRLKNCKEKIAEHIIKVKTDAIENSVVKPLKEAMKKELNENVLYNKLSLAEKDEIEKEVIKRNKEIRLTQSIKDRQIETTNEILRNIGGTNNRYGGSFYKTILGNLNNLSNGSNIEKINAGAYILGSVDNGIKSIVNDVSKIASSLFGDSLNEQVEEVAFDKKLGLRRGQARIVKKLLTKETSYENAKEGFDIVSQSLKPLRLKLLQGEDLSDREEEMVRYYEKYIRSFNDVYKKENKKNIKQEENNIKEKNNNTFYEMGEVEAEGYKEEDLKDNTLYEMNEKESEGYTDEDFKKKEDEEMKYNLTFNNEIGTGDYESKKLHKPSSNSGVTIGAGYDLKHREKDEIKNDLLEAGLSNTDAEMISNGAGLVDEEAEKFLENNKNINITDEQQEKLFQKVIPVYEARAIKGYNKIDLENKPNYEELPQKVKDLLVDYAYNVGVETFPKLFKAVIKGDEETALEQYKRYTDGKQLGKRNEDTLLLLNSYDFKDLTI